SDTVSATVNASFDAAAARDAILAGVTSLGDPIQPGHMVVYGPTAASIATYAGGGLADPMIAAATLGAGRVIAVPDHQWLQMGRFTGDASTGAFYRNGIGWLAGTASLDVPLVVYDGGNQSRATESGNWLVSQGYTHVTVATAATLTSDLQGAEVLVASWLGAAPSEALFTAVRDFAVGGGGLFIGEYGVGHEWWWGNAPAEIPGNRLLRDAGIGFPGGWPHEGTSWPVERAVGQVTADTILAVLAGSSGLTQSQQLEALAVYRRLNAVLAPDDPLAVQLAAALAERTGMIAPVPAAPVTDAIEKLLLQIEAERLAALPPAAVTAHRTAAAVYGQIPAGAPRLTGRVVTLDGDKTGWVATGLYAAPGELVTVRVPAALVGQGFTVRVGGHTDDISSRESWSRVPSGVSRSFAIAATEVAVANAFGGAIYLDFGGQASGTSPGLGAISSEVDGAIEAPLFVLGQTTNAEWIAGLRDRPAPYAELVSNRVAFSVPSAWIRSLDNPAAVMAAWDDAIAFQDYVGGFEALRTGPDRFNIDVQISVGWLHSGYPTQGPVAYGSGFLDPAVLVSSGDWGLMHEFGHEQQRQPALGWGYDTNPWTFEGDVEISANIFANAALERMAPEARGGWAWSIHPDEVMRKAAAQAADTGHPGFEQKDPHAFFFQLADGPWGWEGYRTVMSGYVADAQSRPAALPRTNQEKKDQWLIRWSEATGFDMRQYMVGSWGLEVSQAALDAVAAMNLPNWMPLAVAGEGIWFDGQGPVTFDLARLGLGLDGAATLMAAGQPTRGTLVGIGAGQFTYTPGPSFSGQDSFTATFESSAGNRQSFPVAVLAGGGWLETFAGIPGNAIADLEAAPTYPGSPTTAFVLTSLEATPDVADEFGQRLRARVTPPVTGDYTFWIASDDNGVLRLSSDANPANAVPIASVPGYTARRAWTQYPEQRSQVIRLAAGRSYFLEALAKDGGGGDHLAVAWTGPGISEPTVIGGAALALHRPPTVPVLSGAFVMENQPSGTVVGELSATDPDPGDQVTFSIVPGPAAAAFVIDGNRLKTLTSFNFERQGGYQLTVRATDPNGFSSEQTFTIQVGDEFGEPFVIQSIAPPPTGLRRAGEFLQFTVSTSQAATVRLQPQLPIRIGGRPRLATYVQGSGTTELTFRYRVAVGDNGTVGLGSRFVIPAGGGIVSAGQRLPLALPQATTPPTAVLVDTIAPRSVGAVVAPTVGTYGFGAVLRFTVRLSEPVSVRGTPRLGLVINASAGGRQAVYVSGSGTRDLVFEYRVQSRDRTPPTRGIQLGARLVVPSGSGISDFAGNLAVPMLQVPATGRIRIDGRLGSG
ncbi:MAG: M60 family metallopeptidase, partial [Planctomycetota bacterium]